MVGNNSFFPLIVSLVTEKVDFRKVLRNWRTRADLCFFLHAFTIIDVILAFTLTQRSSKDRFVRVDLRLLVDSTRFRSKS